MNKFRLFFPPIPLSPYTPIPLYPDTRYPISYFKKLFFSLTNYQILLAIVCSTLFSSRSLKKRPEPVKTTANENIINTLLEKQNRFQNLSIRTKVEMEMNGKKYSSPATIRIVKDSAIWASVTPFLGIEAVRVLFRQDSIFINNRLQNQYLKFSYDSLSKWLHASITYKFVELAISGEFIPNAFTLVPLNTDSTLLVCSLDSKELKGISWINRTNYHLNQLKLSIDGKDSLLANYDDYRETDGLIFPFYSKVDVSGNEFKIIMTAKHTKLEKDIPGLKLPFTQNSNVKQE